jgi:hypothetical protein
VFGFGSTPAIKRTPVITATDVVTYFFFLTDILVPAFGITAKYFGYWYNMQTNIPLLPKLSHNYSMEQSPS